MATTSKEVFISLFKALSDRVSSLPGPPLAPTSSSSSSTSATTEFTVLVDLLCDEAVSTEALLSKLVETQPDSPLGATLNLATLHRLQAIIVRFSAGKGDDGDWGTLIKLIQRVLGELDAKEQFDRTQGSTAATPNETSSRRNPASFPSLPTAGASSSAPGISSSSNTNRLSTSYSSQAPEQEGGGGSSSVRWKGKGKEIESSTKANENQRRDGQEEDVQMEEPAGGDMEVGNDAEKMELDEAIHGSNSTEPPLNLESAEESDDRPLIGLPKVPTLVRSTTNVKYGPGLKERAKRGEGKGKKGKGKGKAKVKSDSDDAMDGSSTSSGPEDQGSSSVGRKNIQPSAKQKKASATPRKFSTTKPVSFEQSSSPYSSSSSSPSSSPKAASTSPATSTAKLSKQRTVVKKKSVQNAGKRKVGEVDVIEISSSEEEEQIGTMKGKEPRRSGGTKGLSKSSKL